MSRTVLEPIIHPVFNEFDKFGLLLGLPRLEEESNADYKWRLLDVFIHRASSTYHGLIYGITRELGLAITRVLRITMPESFPIPAVEFDGTKCILYENYLAGTIHAEFERFNKQGGVWTLEQLVDAINQTVFTAELLPDADPSSRSMGVFRQSSIGSVISEDIEGKGSRIQLQHPHLIENTISITSSTLLQRVYTQEDLRVEGQYYIDPEPGLVFTTTSPSAGSRIRYKYRQNPMTFEYSPIIIHDLHAENFRSVMFEPYGENIYGRPTAFGADIINELLSVYPYSWGK